MACRVCWSFRRPASKKNLAAIEVLSSAMRRVIERVLCLAFGEVQKTPEYVAFLLFACCCCLVMGWVDCLRSQEVRVGIGAKLGATLGFFAAIGSRLSPLSCRSISWSAALRQAFISFSLFILFRLPHLLSALTVTV